MTKEDILKDKCKAKKWDKSYPCELFRQEAIFPAMEQFTMQECLKFGDFLSHNFSTTNKAEEWRCDETNEIYGIDELYAKYVQYTQAGRV